MFGQIMMYHNDASNSHVIFSTSNIKMAWLKEQFLYGWEQFVEPTWRLCDFILQSSNYEAFYKASAIKSRL